MSLLTDTASEAIYPLLPIFLGRVLGAGAISLGLIEGVAEAAHALFRVSSGWISDRLGARRPLVLAGYTVSSLVRPLMALAGSWGQVLAIRFVDRVGKGLRGAPRDAMLAAYGAISQRGLIFGVHRAMDHLGAVLGPLLASAFLFAFPGEYRTLFFLTVVPGIATVLLVLRVREVPGREGEAAWPRRSPATAGVEGGADRWPDADAVHPRVEARLSILPARFWGVLAILFVFTLGNSTDAFLLLRLSDVGISTPWIPLTWTALHIVKAVTSVLGGELSDRWGRARAISAGWAVYAASYAGFAMSESAGTTLLIFLTYGAYYGLTEGSERALVADLAPPAVRGTALGLVAGAIGAGSLMASVMFGALWEAAGFEVAFGVGAALALVSSALLLRVAPN